MEGRKKELKKLKVDALKLIASGVSVTSLVRKKDDLITVILQNEFPPDSDQESSHVLTNTDPAASSEEAKRVKVAPIFAMSVSKRTSECPLCEGEKSLWSEVGLAVCPVCSDAVCVTPSPSVKQETGVTSLSFSYNADGHVILSTGTADVANLPALVGQYGFGLCESLEALNEHKDPQEAAEWLMNRHRNSAENSSITEAQLNSEQVREDTKESKKRSQRDARQVVVSDISVLLEIDAEFCSKFVFADGEVADDGRVLAWLLDADAHRLSAFDYLVLKRDSVKWYKAPAARYFDAVESQELTILETSRISEWFETHIKSITDAVYNIPVTGGSIPLLFRNTFEAHTHDDIEIKEVSSQRSHDEIVLLE